MKETDLLTEKANQGDTGAQLMLGIMYAKGVDLDLDFKEAAKWYRKAADNGNAQAQFYYGSLLVIGNGVSRNGEEALKWFLQSAEQGYAEAQYQLALNDVDNHNFVDAYKWITLAYCNSSFETHKKYSELKEIITKELSSAQMIQATKEAKLIRKKFKKA